MRWQSLQASDLLYCPDGSFGKKIRPWLRQAQTRLPMMGVGFGVSFWAWAAKDPDRTNHRYRAKAWGKFTERCLESMCQGEETDRLPGCSAPLAQFRLDSFTKGWDSWELEDMEKKAPVREEHKGYRTVFSYP